MKRPGFFVVMLFVITAILLFIDIPMPVRLGHFRVPLVNQEISLNFDQSKINLNLGLIEIDKDLEYRLGLDLQGGTSFIYQIDMTEVPEDNREIAFEGARSIVERRINFFGVTEPNIQSVKLSDEYRIIVELPGEVDVNQAISLIGQTALLTFWEDGDTPLATEEAELLPLGLSNIYQNKPNKTELTGKDLRAAEIVYGGSDGSPQVQLNFTQEGAKMFGDITKRNVDKPVAIVLDDVVISAPVVQQAILSGDAVISGSFTQEQAKNLSIQLNSGALPAPLELIGQNTVGPSLGIESLKKSLVGGIIGFISLVIFMVLIYKKEGVFASLALIIYTIIVLFIFKAIPITLTLAGIAALILSIGMAVDANILIFERLKEELRSGKPKHIATEIGFRRAWPSIRDSNITSLITTAILFYFGSGIIRGFAVALAIGIIVSMFSAIVVTRNLLYLFDGKKEIQN